MIRLETSSLRAGRDMLPALLYEMNAHRHDANNIASQLAEGSCFSLVIPQQSFGAHSVR